MKPDSRHGRGIENKLQFNMKQAKWIAFSAMLVLWAMLPYARSFAATTDFQLETGTDYVVRNVETGLFLRCSSDKLHAAYFGSMSESDFTYYLWKFKSLGG